MNNIRKFIYSMLILFSMSALIAQSELRVSAGTTMVLTNAMLSAGFGSLYMEDNSTLVLSDDIVNRTWNIHLGKAYFGINTKIIGTGKDGAAGNNAKNIPPTPPQANYCADGDRNSAVRGGTGTDGDRGFDIQITVDDLTPVDVTFALSGGNGGIGGDGGNGQQGGNSGCKCGKGGNGGLGGVAGTGGNGGRSGKLEIHYKRMITLAVNKDKDGISTIINKPVNEKNNVHRTDATAGSEVASSTTPGIHPSRNIGGTGGKGGKGGDGGMGGDQGTCLGAKGARGDYGPQNVGGAPGKDGESIDTVLSQIH